MAHLIEANDIAGLKVYGQQQVDYTVAYDDGTKSGCDFGAAVARASMLRSVAVERALTALADVVRLRERKLTDLGEALAYISAAAASFKDKDKTGDTTTSAGLYTAKKILEKYNIGCSEIKEINAGGSIFNGMAYVTKGDVSLVQTNVQYEADKEDNYLQQDMVTLQSYFSKRDQALSTAASLVKKVNRTMSSGIQTIQ